MRLYKLLKYLPTVKAGAIFKEKIKIDGTRVLKACESGRKHSILVREIDNFDEWFEPTDSINWKLKWGDRYWHIDYWGKAAEQHIEENGHHYDNPTICVRSAHDNRELKDVIHLLILAGGNEIPSNHYGALRDA